MRVALRLRSRAEQKAVFSKMSYREFCDKANKDFWNKLASGSSVKDMTFREFNKKLDKEFNAGYPSSFKDKILTDKTMEMKHTYFGMDRPYDEFWFERKNKFSELSEYPDDAFDDDDYDYRYPTTELSRR